MALHPFCILYRDSANQIREFCTYAFDAYHARCEAIELVQHIHDHPTAITCIRREHNGFDW